MNAELALKEKTRQLERFAKGLADLFASGLIIKDEPDESPYEHAIMCVAAAQLRAITIALAVGEVEAGLPEPEGDRVGWCCDDRFTKHDALAALGGVTALLDVAREILPEMRRNLPCDSGSPAESEAAE